MFRLVNRVHVHNLPSSHISKPRACKTSGLEAVFFALIRPDDRASKPRQGQEKWSWSIVFFFGILNWAVSAIFDYPYSKEYLQTKVSVAEGQDCIYKKKVHQSTLDVFQITYKGKRSLCFYERRLFHKVHPVFLR